MHLHTGPFTLPLLSTVIVTYITYILKPKMQCYKRFYR